MQAVEFAWYGQFGSGQVEREEFLKLEPMARAELERYQRIYHVRGENVEQFQQAVCDMVDCLSSYLAGCEGEFAKPIQLGSVKWEQAEGVLPPVTHENLRRELYRCVLRYLDVYRGV